MVACDFAGDKEGEEVVERSPFLEARATDVVVKDDVGGVIGGSSGNGEHNCFGEWLRSLRVVVCEIGVGLSIETEEVGKVPVFCRGSVSAGGAGGAGICGVMSRHFIEIAEDKWE